jgi:hypothetical protein
MTAVTIGCSRGPARVAAPDWDPSGLAEQLISELDKNGDSQVSEEELKAAPGFAAGTRLFDADKNGQVSREEIELRLTEYAERKIGARAHSFQISYKGRPVPNADVVFLPEPMLEGVIEPARGKTDSEGIVAPQTDGIDVPAMRVGYYRVQVTSPKIPAKYQNENTPLGTEVSDHDDAASYGVTPLKLTD